jgi:biopolymer transport protein ExbB
LIALTQSIARLKPALTVVLVWAPLLAVRSNQATAGEPSVTVAELPQDLSPWGMFLHADQIVKVVMIGLAVASLVTCDSPARPTRSRRVTNPCAGA